jgi:hypothetical protein
MTSQTKKFIELSDIVGLRFECKNKECRAILTLPLLDYSNLNHPLQKCPNCGTGWAVLGTAGFESYIEKFVESTKRMAEQPFGFSFMLELKEETKPLVSQT